jgi:hypothetical protein
VTSDRHGFWRWPGNLGIGVLILSVVHVPLPQADYHNIRHHDAPGEICGYHDHLLRWHPSADFDDDVTMLHWHWFVPSVELGDHHPTSDDEHQGAGPALHAHLGDWPAPNWQAEPVVRPDTRGRLLDHLVLGQSDTSRGSLSDQLAPLDPLSGKLFAQTPSSMGGLRAARIAMFQRWNC